MHIPSLPRLLVVILCLCGTVLCIAQETPEVVLNAAYTVQNGNNLSYVPDILLSAGNNTHHLETVTMGFSVRTQQGMQRLKLDGSLVNRNFESTQATNTVASNYDLLWLWAITPHWTGELGTERRESFDALTNSPFDRQANSTVSNGHHLDVAWELDGAWRVLAGVSQARTVTSRQDPSDQHTQSATTGVRYVGGSGSSLSFKLVATDGEFATVSLSTPITFRERNGDLRLHWVISDASFSDIYLTYIDSTRNAASTQSYHGVNGGAHLTWSLSGPTALQLDFSRTLAATGLDSPLYTETDRIALGPIWRPSAKTAITLHHTWSQQAFRGYSGSTTPRRDTLRTTALSFAWQPRQHWSLRAGLSRLTRDSNDLYAVIASNALTVAAHFSF